MFVDAALAALIAGRPGSRWRRAPGLVELDDHLRRDVGLPPAPAPLPSILAKPGLALPRLVQPGRDGR